MVEKLPEWQQKCLGEILREVFADHNPGYWLSRYPIFFAEAVTARSLIKVRRVSLSSGGRPAYYQTTLTRG